MTFDFETPHPRLGTDSQKWQKYAGRDILPLWVADMDFKSSPSILAALHARVDEGVFGYARPVKSTVDAVVDACARNYGWQIDGSWIVWLPGLVCGLNVTAQAFAQSGDAVLTLTPVYPPFMSAPKNSARVSTQAPFVFFAGRWEIDWAALERAVTPRTKLFYLCNPHNPLARVWRRDELTHLAEFCERHNLVLCADEIYDEITFSEFRENDRFPTPAVFTKDCLLIRGFGKTYGCTGWRLGYVAGPHEIVQSIAKLQQYTYVCAPSMAQYAAAKAYDVDMRPWVDRFEKRRDSVLEAFDGVANVARPGGAFYAFVEVPPALGITATQFVERAIEQSVLVIPGKVFSTRDTHFRLSFAAKEETLARGLSILRGLMKT